MNQLSMLSERLVARAHSLKLKAEKQPAVMQKNRMRGATWAGTMDSAVSDADLPKEYTSFLIGHHAILIGALGMDIRDAHVCLHRFMNQAAIVRSWLPSESSEDLNLFFVGPTGSDLKKEWREFAACIERDERVCRKLVWLPSANISDQESYMDQFINRTFLARPWSDVHAPSEGDIDRLSNLSEKLASEEASRETIDEWLNILRGSQRDNYDLVQQLTQVLPCK